MSVSQEHADLLAAQLSAAHQALDAARLDLERSRDAEQRLQRALWASGEAVWSWSADDQHFRVEPFVNEHGQRVAVPALTKSELIARVHAEDIETFRLTWRMHASGLRHDLDVAFRLNLPQGLRWVRARGRAVERDPQNHALLVSGTVKDITEQREAEESLRLMAQAFTSTRDAIAVTDGNWCIQETNQAYSTLCGLSADELSGQSLALRLSLPADIEVELVERGGWAGASELATLQGESIPVDVNITPLSHFTEGGRGYIVSLTDLREQMRAEARMARMALADALTDLPNRSAIEQHLAARLGEVTPSPFAVIFIDLDGFKEVNDSYGHEVGDQLLRSVARRLTALLPADALVGRWGGDEFVIVLGPGSGDNEVRSVAQVVLAALNQPVMLEAHEVTVTPSIGATLAPRDGNDPGTLLRKADAAMYVAKERGRNGLAFYDPELDTDVQRRVRMQSLLRTDAERNGFTFVAQPKVDRDGHAVGVELLMRWSTPAFGNVSPVEFIPMAEKTGLIGLMGRHALHAAAQLVRRGQDAGHPFTVAVNLSPKQLLQRGLEQQLMVACQRAGIRPDQIELEITESAQVDNMAVVEPLLRRLREIGYTLALDDFGTGYSSLSYLRHLPFNKIKIDRSFVMDIDHDSRAAKLLAHMVQLCAALGMSTVAEGVETQAQFEALRDLGVQEFQGYHFARPMPIDQWLLRLEDEARERAGSPSP
ncbi:putative bifunctional diguanylate cyclase/phosphodiesterase [Sphaerotilus mobilis]|uniref:PAS domain S-box-containing protein/diguanylate cyclase (GGDEF)-like protein n=1 Tax=Sphaerotilus mobilis TaxID=47994 RepID=A0A4Q7LVX0_9BURK|nr:EAL domain-containing protein [Sphaerotilus mobilis]RZS57829.1 PAS domain S-box-containing protein/diguanylate cyclase (GGDEF)-like protein [Sphaerotilus mobilis]